jgi:hypothetical protein
MESYAEEAKPKLAEIIKEADRLTKAIYDESFKFLAHYYFEDEEKKRCLTSRYRQ